MEVNYNLIIYKDKFIKNELNEENFIKLNIISDKIKNELKIRNYFYEAKIEQLFIKTKDVINSNPNLFNTNFEKNIFILNTIFDSEQIIKYIKSINITNEELDKLMEDLAFNKLYYKKIITSPLEIDDKINKLMEYLGINNKEIVLNKLQQIYYCHNELLKEKQKQLK